MGAESTLWANATFFTADSRPWAEALLTRGEHITYVGDLSTARRLASAGTIEVDLGGALVIPGFVDGHAHVTQTGHALQQLDLTDAVDLADIQYRLKVWSEAHPDAARLRLFGWQHSAIPDGGPTRQMLDAVVADRPVYAQSFDFHSAWLNTAAMAEADIDADTPNPHGGTVYRDPETCDATGFLDETAVQLYLWPKFDAFDTDDDRDRHVAQAMASYREYGVTSVTDMGLSDEDLAAFLRARRAGTLTTRVTAHCVIRRDPDPRIELDQVRRVAELAAENQSPYLRIAGIKCAIDGTVDGCTAALREPYADGSIAAPVWDLDSLAPVVTAADAAGLQVAMHAIGDEAIRIAVAAIEEAVRLNGPRPRRHRIEHLEVVDPEEIDRLAALGITASMQPVHADPAIQANWRAMLGDSRVDRGFPWPEMTDAGATLAFGTDSPTAPFQPLRNMFIAATRRSAFDPSLEPNVARYAIPLEHAVRHATADAAWACGADGTVGRLRAGLYADFVVLDRNVFALPLEQLLDAKVTRTVVSGRSVYAS